jgi:hypothetical protein
MTGPTQPDATRRSLLFSLGKGGTFLLLGCATGLFVFAVSFLKLRYAVPLLAGLALPLVAVLTGRAKFFFQMLLVLSIGLLVRKTLAFVSENHTGGVLGLDVLFLDFVLFILYVIWIYEGFILKKPGEGITVPKIAWIWLAYILVSVLSTSQAPEIRYCLFEILRQIKVFLFFLYVVNHFNNPKMIRMAMAVLGVIVILHTIVTFLQRFTGQTFYVPFLMLPPERGGNDIKLATFYLRRPGGLFGNANCAAAFLAILLPACFSTLFWKGKTAVKAFFAGVFFVGLTALIDTYSRAGWLTIPPAAVMLISLGLKKGFLSFRRHLAVFFSVAIFFLLILAFYAKPIHMRLTTPTGSSTYSRIYLMQISMKMILNRPLLGHGVNNWNLSYIPYHQATYDPHDSLIEFKGYYHVVHNIFFIIAVDTGLVGLFLFLWILFEMGKNALAGLRTRDPFVASLSMGLLTCLVSFCIVETFDFSYLQYEFILFMFWLLIGFSVYVKRFAEATRRTTAPGFEPEKRRGALLAPQTAGQ